jgi:2-hydroxycyclohexanecarboxyl-CoA dehydrogenase
MRGLKSRTVVVTGAASGIGRAIAARFGAEGSRVAVLDLDAAGAQATVEAIRSAGGEAAAFRVDISDEAQVRKAVADCSAALGAIDVLVNNAGWDRAMPFLKTDTALWQKIVGINLMGPLHMHHAVLPGMVERRQGRVINISSDAARVGSSGEAVYAACKGGMVSFTKTMARELARSNIQLNVVCPGPTDTPLFTDFAGAGERGEKLREALKGAIPMRRLGEPSDYPGIVAFLASDDAAFITGQVISVSGGLTMAG